MMVGSLGTQATAAVGSTGTINWLIGSTISAVGVGFLSYIAKAYGAKDEDSAKRAVAQAVLITCVLGVFFTVLTVSLSGVIPVWMQVDPGIQRMASTYFLILYLPMLPRTASIIFGTVLRSAGDTRSPMKIGLLVNLINVALNFLLIYPTRQIRLFSLNLTISGRLLPAPSHSQWEGCALPLFSGGIPWFLHGDRGLSRTGRSLSPV